MKNRLLIYFVFFALLLGGFWFFLFRDYDFSASKLAIINDNVSDFLFVNQNNDTITQQAIQDKVYIVEYFFTTCQGICPKMNANMRRVYDAYKNEENFFILSHTCMPEIDSVPLLKKYESKMLNGKLIKEKDGAYAIQYDSALTNQTKTNWYFLTGDKNKLYDMARNSYKIDNDKPNPQQNISDQFIHSQFFALVDKQRRVRGIYDGLKNDEVDKLIIDIKDLLKEKITSKRFMNGFSNNPE